MPVTAAVANALPVRLTRFVQHHVRDNKAGKIVSFAAGALAPDQIARDDAATEPENRVVGGGDRLRLVPHWNDSRHGTEQFVLVGRHAFAHVSQNGGWVISPGM